MPQTAKKLNVEIKKNIGIGYLLHMPDGHKMAKETKYPLVIFLHGSGERGEDVSKLKVYAIPKMVEKKSPLLGGYEFIAVSPQCREGVWWHEQEDEFGAFLNHCLETLPVDTSRIYLTGLSMGGYGTWHFAMKYPHAFAAGVPICGGVIDEEMDRVGRIAHLPLWVFHGTDDRAVPLSKSAIPVAILNEMGGDVRFTVYPGVGHDSWTAAYDTPALYKWMFAQRNEYFSI